MLASTDRRGRRPVGSLPVLAVLVLVVAMGGSATAAALITGKQIKDGSVTGKDLKDGSVTTRDLRNGSLLLKDFKASERAKLKGDSGASGFAPPPSGTTISGAEIVNATVSASLVSLRNFVNLPFTTAAPLVEGDNLHFGTPNPGTTGVPAGDIDATACPGTAAAPAPAPGQMCVYVKQSFVGVAPDSAALFDGLVGGADEGDRAGFVVRVDSNAAGEVDFRFVWAYQAP